jgi:hypothetical protein
MQIVVTRVDGHQYSTMVERDGVQLRVPGYSFMRALPHDLAHFVIEDTLRLDRGFWGSIASGAEFRGMERIDGRRKPHAAWKAKTTSKENADYLSEAERLVACFERIVDHNLDRVSATGRGRSATSSRNRPASIENEHSIGNRQGVCRMASDAGALG